MPFKSKAQQKYMFMKHPKIAKEMADKTKSFKKLPNKVKKSKSKKSEGMKEEGYEKEMYDRRKNIGA